MYRIERNVPHVPTVLVNLGLLFLWSEKGIASCHDVASGKQHWQQRVGGNFAASPVCVAGRLYNISEEGEMVVLAAADRYEELARFDVGESSFSTPAIALGRMFLRTRGHLYSIGGEK